MGGDASRNGAELFKIRADFSAKIVTFRLVGGDASPPSPPLNPPLTAMKNVGDKMLKIVFMPRKTNSIVQYKCLLKKFIKSLQKTFGRLYFTGNFCLVVC